MPSKIFSLIVSLSLLLSVSGIPALAADGAIGAVKPSEYPILFRANSVINTALALPRDPNNQLEIRISPYNSMMLDLADFNSLQSVADHLAPLVAPSDNPDLFPFIVSPNMKRAAVKAAPSPEINNLNKLVGDLRAHTGQALSSAQAIEMAVSNFDGSDTLAGFLGDRALSVILNHALRFSHDETPFRNSENLARRLSKTMLIPGRHETKHVNAIIAQPVLHALEKLNAAFEKSYGGKIDPSLLDPIPRDVYLIGSENWGPRKKDTKRYWKATQKSRELAAHSMGLSGPFPMMPALGAFHWNGDIFIANAFVLESREFYLEAGLMALRLSQIGLKKREIDSLLPEVTERAFGEAISLADIQRNVESIFYELEPFESIKAPEIKKEEPPVIKLSTREALIQRLGKIRFDSASLFEKVSHFKAVIFYLLFLAVKKLSGYSISEAETTGIFIVAALNSIGLAVVSLSPRGSKPRPKHVVASTASKSGVPEAIGSLAFDIFFRKKKPGYESEYKILRFTSYDDPAQAVSLASYHDPDQGTLNLEISFDYSLDHHEFRHISQSEHTPRAADKDNAIAIEALSRQFEIINKALAEYRNSEPPKSQRKEVNEFIKTFNQRLLKFSKNAVLLTPLD